MTWTLFMQFGLNGEIEYKKLKKQDLHNDANSS